MARGRSQTVKNVLILIFATLLVGGALAYRLYPDAKERREHRVQARLEPGEHIVFDTAMHVTYHQSSVGEDASIREVRFCVAQPGAEAIILKNGDGFERDTVILRYLGTAGAVSSQKECEFRGLIQVARPAIEAIVRGEIERPAPKQQ